MSSTEKKSGRPKAATPEAPEVINEAELKHTAVSIIEKPGVGYMLVKIKYNPETGVVSRPELVKCADTVYEANLQLKIFIAQNIFLK